jgi:hypothetical protein
MAKGVSLMRRKRISAWDKIRYLEQLIVIELQAYPYWPWIVEQLRKRPKYQRGIYNWALERANETLSRHCRCVSCERRHPPKPSYPSAERKPS